MDNILYYWAHSSLHASQCLLEYYKCITMNSHEIILLPIFQYVFTAHWTALRNLFTNNSHILKLFNRNNWHSQRLWTFQRQFHYFFGSLHSTNSMDTYFIFSIIFVHRMHINLLLHLSHILKLFWIQKSLQNCVKWIYCGHIHSLKTKPSIKVEMVVKSFDVHMQLI